MAWHDWVLTGTSPCSSVLLGYSRSASAKPGWRTPLGGPWTHQAICGSVSHHGATYTRVLTGLLTGYSQRYLLIVYPHRTLGVTHGVLTGVLTGSVSDGRRLWQYTAVHRATACKVLRGISHVRYLRGLDGYSLRPPHPSEYRVQSTAHVGVPGGPRLLFGIGLRHARRTVVRVRSADSRSDTCTDQPRGHQPADARADARADLLRTDAIADVSRRCALRALDAAESSDGAGPVPWYRPCSTSGYSHGTPLRSAWQGDPAALGTACAAPRRGLRRTGKDFGLYLTGTQEYSRVLAGGLRGAGGR
jgi:hypothetical protein